MAGRQKRRYLLLCIVFLACVLMFLTLPAILNYGSYEKYFSGKPREIVAEFDTGSHDIAIYAMPSVAECDSFLIFFRGHYFGDGKSSSSQWSFTDTHDKSIEDESRFESKVVSSLSKLIMEKRVLHQTHSGTIKILYREWQDIETIEHSEFQTTPKPDYEKTWIIPEE